MQRYIAHFDLDSFFVSVEILNDPSLKGKAVVVGGSRERGVVTSASYEARKYGVHSAMPMHQAMRLCPHATVVKGTRGEYSRYSRIVTEIIAAKAPLFEKASIDEFYLDLTGMDRFFDPYQWTISLREEIIVKTGLPISFALASNKMVAKIATDDAKPNGYLFIQPGQEREYLAPMKVSKIPGVGESTYNTLLEMGLPLIRDVAAADIAFLRKELGNYGEELQQKALGIHHGVVSPWRESKSISTENTFHEDSADTEFLFSELVRMTEKVAYELRSENMFAGCFTVKLRYSDFTTTSKQTSLDYARSDEDFIPVARELFMQLWRRGAKIRLLGVRVSDLIGETDHSIQGSLFEDRTRKDNLYKAIDAVKDKFGGDALSKATALRAGRVKDAPHLSKGSLHKQLPVKKSPEKGE